MNSLERKLYEAAVRGIQDVGDQMFAYSQRIVNVDRGTLKKSGFIEYLPDGVRWGYRAPYARTVNDGVPQGRMEQVREHAVRAHKRRPPGRTKAGHRRRKTIMVKQHTRGPFVRAIKARQGSRFMERSIEHVRPQISRIIGRKLRLA